MTGGAPGSKGNVASDAVGPLGNLLTRLALRGDPTLPGARDAFSRASSRLIPTSLLHPHARNQAGTIGSVRAVASSPRVARAVRRHRHCRRGTYHHHAISPGPRGAGWRQMSGSGRRWGAGHRPRPGVPRVNRSDCRDGELRSERIRGGSGSSAAGGPKKIDGPESMRERRRLQPGRPRRTTGRSDSTRTTGGGPQLQAHIRRSRSGR